jgi:hypothetical protein
MTALEGRCRWLLRAYPSWYRRQRGEEMIGTLMAASPRGRRWPSLRDIRALIMGGLRVRAGQHQRLSTPASLRLAGLLGVALALLWLIGNNLGSAIMFWSHVYPAAAPGSLTYQAAASMLALAAVLAAWFAPWPAVAAPALAGAALWIYSGDRVVASQPAGLLILLVILTAGRDRMPRSWLGLAGLLFTLTLLEQFTADLPVYRADLYTALSFAPWVVLGAVILWATVDARPAVAMTIYLASNYLLFTLIGYVGYGAAPAAAWEWYLPVVGVTVLGACALWRLRRQAAL